MMMMMMIARARSAKQSGISWGQKLLTPISYDIMFRLVYFAQRNMARARIFCSAQSCCKTGCKNYKIFFWKCC